MFILPSIALGVAIALAVGGKPSRLLELRFRAPWFVLGALALQVVLFSRPGEAIPDAATQALHVVSYGLLLAFGALNRRVRALWVLLAGLLLNAVAIGANEGEMPLSAGAAAAAGVEPGANVAVEADRLRMLGDVFAMPAELPLANAFSVGDILIGVGMVLLIVHGSVRSPFLPLLRFGRLRGPLAVSDFRSLTLGRFVSTCGDWLTTAALVGWVFTSSGSTLWVALVLLARIAPPILGGGAAAAAADRIPKRTLLVGVEIARGIVLLGALGAVLADSRLAVLACMAVSGGLAAVTASVVPAFVPALVPDHKLEPANALLGVIENVGMAAGALCGGLALSHFGAPTALALDVVTFAVAALIYARVRTRIAPEEDDGGEPSQGSLRYVVTHRRLAAAIGCFGVAIVATGLANVTLPTLLRDDLGASEGAYGFGLAAIGLGLAAGNLAFGSVQVGTEGMRWLATGLALMAGMFAVLALVDHAPTAFLLLAAIGFVDGTTDGVFDTVVQREADASRHGGIFGVASTVFSSAMLVSVAGAPVLNGIAPAGVVIAVSALALVAAAAVAFAGVRAPAVARPQPRPAPRAA